MIGATEQPGRLSYIDWMRGLACVIMFQAHGFDSWLSPVARQSGVYTWSQRLATIPAPIFLFLCGVSVVLVTERLRAAGSHRDAIAATTIKRGAGIYVLGLIFRIQEFVLGFPKSPWTDLVRVDVLNILGISMMLLGAVCWITAPGSVTHDGQRRTSASFEKARFRAAGVALVAAAVIAMSTPLLWTVDRPSRLGWVLESYFNGVHNFGAPQPWLFPLFPWSAFAFVGLAVGFFLCSELARPRETRVVVSLAIAGFAVCLVAMALDALPLHLYPVYDFWRTSPNFFLFRCGLLLLILSFTQAWCRWGPARKGFSVFTQLGMTSLLVYWVHIEFVYGRLSILPKGRCGIPEASLGIAVIFAAMTALSIWRTRRMRRSKVSTSYLAPALSRGSESPTAM